MMSDVRIIEGEIFKDFRGQICSLNAFRFDGVQRFYFIHHPDVNVIRGWHGHKFEKKWFYCAKGAFTLALVRPDDWDSPSLDLKPLILHLTETDSKIVCVPEGYANCLKASAPDSVMMVFSGKLLEDALNDSWRFDSKLWIDWSKF